MSRMRTLDLEMSELIDIYLAIQMSEPAWNAEEFLLEFFPSDTNAGDFKNYMNDYRLIEERQRPAIQDEMIKLRRKLMREDRWAV